MKRKTETSPPFGGLGWGLFYLFLEIFQHPWKREEPPPHHELELRVAQEVGRNADEEKDNDKPDYCNPGFFKTEYFIADVGIDLEIGTFDQYIVM